MLSYNILVYLLQVCLVLTQQIYNGFNFKAYLQS